LYLLSFACDISSKTRGFLDGVVDLHPREQHNFTDRIGFIEMMSMFLKKRRWLVFLALFAFRAGTAARADIAFLMEEPYGGFGSVNPTGHGAVYFNHICAESPTQLRMCKAGERGVVISRYHRVAGYDWLAMPLIPYLYSVDRVQDIPMSADRELRDRLRDAYRRKRLLQIAPDVVTKEDLMVTPKGEWTQLVGSSYDRTIYGFQVETTREQDKRFVAYYNDRRNKSHFNLFFHNCADFSRGVLNFYFPHSVGRSWLVDLGMTTPKQVARSLSKYAKKNPELPFTVFVIPQIEGEIPRSHPVDGVVESLVKSKKYVVPLAVFYPEFTAVMGVAYLTDGRFKPPKDAPEVLLPGESARTAIARWTVKSGKAVASVDAHPGVHVEDERRPLNQHRVDLEGGKGEGVAGGLSRTAE
jgi:hypothetical protein